MKKFDNITRQYREVEIQEGFYTQDGQKLFRVETRGRSGKVLYRSQRYIRDGKEVAPFGMGGSTGHGWGGSIKGYLLESELEKYGVK